MLVNTLSMEDMPTVRQWRHIFELNINKTNLALYFLFIKLPLPLSFLSDNLLDLLYILSLLIVFYLIVLGEHHFNYLCGFFLLVLVKQLAFPIIFEVVWVEGEFIDKVGEVLIE